MNKRGQGLSTGTIILLVLGVIILAILAIGFLAGWNTFSSWFSSDNNVDEIVQACQTACLTQSTYDYCTRERTLEATDLPGDVKEMKGTCEFFATDENYIKYGIEACDFNCPSS